MRNFCKYFFIPCGFLVVAVLYYRGAHYLVASWHVVLFGYWIWRYPWFVKLVVRSLTGREP